MNRICVGQTVGILFAFSSSLVPASLRGQAGDDVILIEATAPESERHEAAKFRCGHATWQILKVIDDSGYTTPLGWSHFAASRDVLAKQICALEAAAHEAEKDAETQDRESETDTQVDDETVDERMDSPKPMFFLKTSSDPQGGALRDAIRALFEMADALESQHLPLRAASLRDLAKRMRIDMLRGPRDRDHYVTPLFQIGGLGMCPDPSEINLAEDLLKKWERLPPWHKPRTDHSYNNQIFRLPPSVELGEELYLLGKPNGSQDTQPARSRNVTEWSDK